MIERDFVAAFIVPTGVGASIGGFAGDASQAARSIAEVCPLIVNPNVVNAAVFSGITDSMLYTEGLAIDKLFKGEIALRPSRKNKIGVIFDSAIPENILNIHINTINAVKTVYGIDVIAYEITDQPAGVEFSVLESGISSGTLTNPDTLIAAGKKLINKGASALAVVCLFEDSDDDDYANGEGVDPVGGVEAIISHILTDEFYLPVAHAPAFAKIDIPGEIVDKRAAAEYITPTFLPCILLGLNNAPKLISPKEAGKTDITIDNVKALITPANCLGGIPVLSAIERNIPVIAVEENITVLDITADNLGIQDRVIKVQTYNEAKDVIESLATF